MQITDVADGQATRVKRKRIPVRLGSCVFGAGSISGELISEVVDAMSRFQQIFAEHGVTRVFAVATSATREADNHAELVEAVRESCGITFNVISRSSVSGRRVF